MKSAKGENEIVVGHVKAFKKNGKDVFRIDFPKMPADIKAFRSAVRDVARIRYDGMGGITVSPKDPCFTSELAYSIGELGLGLSIDARTIPIQI